MSDPGSFAGGGTNTLDATAKKLLDGIEQNVAALREHLDRPAGEGAPQGSEDLSTTKRQLQFLDAFDQAGGRLHMDEAAMAARAVGFDPRGTGGFYTYNGSLKRDGDYRVLTDVGREWLHRWQRLIEK